MPLVIKSRSSTKPPLDELELLEDEELELEELELEDEFELDELLELDELEELDEELEDELELLDDKTIPEELEELDELEELELLDEDAFPDELEEELEDDELLEPGGKIPPPQATSAADIMPTTAKRKDSVLTLLNPDTDIAMTPRKNEISAILTEFNAQTGVHP